MNNIADEEKADYQTPPSSQLSTSSYNEDDEDDSSRQYFTGESLIESDQPSNLDLETFESLTPDNDIAGDSLHSDSPFYQRASQDQDSSENYVEPPYDSEDSLYIEHDIGSDVDYIYSPSQDETILSPLSQRKQHSAIIH